MSTTSGDSYNIETITLGERAQLEIDIAREQGVDPLVIAETHRNLGQLIRHLLSKEKTS